MEGIAEGLECRFRRLDFIEQAFVDFHYFYSIVLKCPCNWTNIYFREMILRQFDIANDNH